MLQSSIGCTRGRHFLRAARSRLQAIYYIREGKSYFARALSNKMCGYCRTPNCQRIHLHLLFLRHRYE